MSDVGEAIVSFWGDFPDLWDHIVIADKPTLGLATVLITKAGNVDQKAPPGINGATLTHLGFEPAQVQVRLRMWEREHWAAYLAIVDLVEPKSGEPPQPVDVYHPTLAAHNVRSLYFVRIEPPRPTSIPGVMEAVFTAQEFRPKKNGGVLTPVKSTDYTDPRNVQTAFGQTKPKGPPSETALKP